MLKRWSFQEFCWIFDFNILIILKPPWMITFSRAIIKKIWARTLVGKTKTFMSFCRIGFFILRLALISLVLMIYFWIELPLQLQFARYFIKNVKHLFVICHTMDSARWNCCFGSFIKNVNRFLLKNRFS